jgi:hypothetical protein
MQLPPHRFLQFASSGAALPDVACIAEPFCATLQSSDLIRKRPAGGCAEALRVNGLPRWRPRANNPRNQSETWSARAIDRLALSSVA